MKTTRIDPSSQCPKCKTEIDSASDIDGKATPKPGDLSVCAYCGHMLFFTADMKARSLPGLVFLGLPEPVRDALGKMQTAVALKNAANLLK